MLLWRLFLEDLAADFETRRDYLLGHAPAPALWADWVDQVLYPDRPFGSLEPDSPEGRERCARLTALGLLQE